MSLNNFAQKVLITLLFSVSTYSEWKTFFMLKVLRRSQKMINNQEIAGLLQKQEQEADKAHAPLSARAEQA